MWIMLGGKGHVGNSDKGEELTANRGGSQKEACGGEQWEEAAGRGRKPHPLLHKHRTVAGGAPLRFCRVSGHSLG